MTDIMQSILERKAAYRKKLAALPVGEKLRMLEEMRDAAAKISASRPPKPPCPSAVHGGA